MTIPEANRRPVLRAIDRDLSYLAGELGSLRFSSLPVLDLPPPSDPDEAAAAAALIERLRTDLSNVVSPRDALQRMAELANRPLSEVEQAMLAQAIRRYVRGIIEQGLAAGALADRVAADDILRALDRATDISTLTAVFDRIDQSAALYRLFAGNDPTIRRDLEIERLRGFVSLLSSLANRAPVAGEAIAAYLQQVDALINSISRNSSAIHRRQTALMLGVYMGTYGAGTYWTNSPQNPIDRDDWPAVANAGRGSDARALFDEPAPDDRLIVNNPDVDPFDPITVQVDAA